MRVPDRLSRLRRDRRGIPVPYVNLWGAEDTSRMVIEFDSNVQQLAVSQLDADQTTPDFTRQNMQRQRECMAVGKCQVCRRYIPWESRFLVVSGISVDTISLHGREVPVVTEPWLDQRCAEFALEKCPGLIRRKTADDLTLVPVRSPDEAVLIVSNGWIDGPLEAESRRTLPAMWAKVALTRVRIEAAS